MSEDNNNSSREGVATNSGNSPVRTRSLSLRTKWTLTFLLGGSIPLVLFGLAALQVQRDGLENAEKLQEAAIADHVSDVVFQVLRETADTTHRVGFTITDPRLPLPQPSPDSPTGSEPPLSVELAKEILANARSVGSVGLYTPQGRFMDQIVRRGEAPPQLPRTLTIPVIPQGQDGVWLPIEYTPQGALLRYCEPIRRDNELRAYFVGTLRLQTLQDTVRDISQDRFASRDGILLLDNSGKIFVSGVDTGPLAAGQSLVGKDILSKSPFEPSSFTQEHVASVGYQYAGVDMVGTLRTIPQNAWAIVVRRKASDVFVSLATARKSLAVAAGGFVVFALALSALLVARTVRPIQSLIDLAKSYAKRQFKTRSSVKTGDELESLGTTMTDMADSIEKSEKEIERRVQVEANLSRFMPEGVAKRIATGERQLTLGGERKTVSVLFADVASFTTFAEGTDPDKVVGFLNELFSVLTEVVFKHQGTVDKFIGDAIMAVFGAPDAQEDHAERAVAAAEDMHRFVEASTAKWKARYGIEPKLAIGINCGEALVGNLGSESRMEYTCIGDTVNIAGRLETLARPGQTLVTANVAQAVSSADFESLGEHPLRGKRQSVEIFELVR